MNGPRDQFFAGARLAQEEHGRIAGGHGFDQSKHFPERYAAADDAFEDLFLDCFLLQGQMPVCVR
jgi:hypothetical protein